MKICEDCIYFSLEKKKIYGKIKTIKNGYCLNEEFKRKKLFINKECNNYIPNKQIF